MLVEHVTKQESEIIMPKKPGSNVRNNGGIYQEVGPHGGPKPNYSTVADNHKLPPTTAPGNVWKLVMVTPSSKRGEK